MLKFIIAFTLCAALQTICGGEPVPMEKEMTPQYLYKILSTEDWTQSQGGQYVKLSKDDSEFIHLSREDQLDRIIEKYWANSQGYVVLKIDVAKLKGTLAFEANPGGTNKYYHLYHGAIPMDSVIEAKPHDLY